MEPRSVTLKPVGDVELWYAQAVDESWRLPLHVEWKAHPETDELYGLVLPGVCFYEVQLLAMRELLRGFALDDRQDRWLMPKANLHSKLYKAPGINAAYYYHWPSGMHPPIPTPYHPMTITQAQKPSRLVEEYRSFADYVAKERNLPSDVVIMVLHAIGQLGAKWMLERREMLNLGFVKLVALPFRSNWKEIVAFKLKPYALGRIMAQATTLRKRLLEGIGFPKTACSTHNIGLKMRNTLELSRLHYTIEAIATEKFEQAADAVEAERTRNGQTSYVGQFEWSVQKHYDSIIHALREHLRKSYVPWAGVRHSSSTGVLTFYPRRRHTGKLGHGTSLDNIPVHIVPPDNRFSVFAETPQASDPTLLHPEDDQMQPLSALPPSPDDVRRRSLNRDVDKPRQAGTAGVPVLDAGQGTGPTEPVLLGDSTASGNSSRMDES